MMKKARSSHGAAAATTQHCGVTTGAAVTAGGVSVNSRPLTVLSSSSPQRLSPAAVHQQQHSSSSSSSSLLSFHFSSCLFRNKPTTLPAARTWLLWMFYSLLVLWMALSMRTLYSINNNNNHINNIIDNSNYNESSSSNNNLPLNRLLPREHHHQQQPTTTRTRKDGFVSSSKKKGETDSSSSGKRKSEESQTVLLENNNNNYNDKEEIDVSLVADDVLCPGCRYDSFLDPNKRGGATCFSRIVKRMDEKQQQRRQREEEEEDNNTILIEAAIMVAEEFPDGCGICDPKSCGLLTQQQQQQQGTEERTIIQHDEKEQPQQQRRRPLYYRVDQAAPRIVDARVHFLQSSLPSDHASRLPPNALNNLTAYFANPLHQYPHRHYYFEFNPSIAVLPRSQIPKKYWKAKKKQQQQHRPIYIAVYRVSNHHNCVTGDNYLNMMGGSHDRAPWDKSFLAVALLNAHLEIVEETVVETRKKFQDPRIFSLPTTTTTNAYNNDDDDDNLQLYLASYRMLVPLWLNQPSNIDRNKIKLLRPVRWPLVLNTTTTRASSSSLSKLEVWLQTDVACTQDRFTWLVGKNLNYFVVPTSSSDTTTTTTNTAAASATDSNRTNTTMTASSVSTTPSSSSSVVRMNIVMEVEPFGPKEYINISRACPKDVVSTKKLQQQRRRQQQQTKEQDGKEKEEQEQSIKDDGSYFIYPPNYSSGGGVTEGGGGGETGAAAAEQLPPPTFSTSDELIFAQRGIVERPYTLERGGACCVRIPDPRNNSNNSSNTNDSSSSLLLGIAHVKTKYKFKKKSRPTNATVAAEENGPGDDEDGTDDDFESNHFFSLFYAMESKPPFSTVARTGRFCFGFPSPEEIKRSGSPYHQHQGEHLRDTLGTSILVVGRQPYPNCPRIHFVSGMIDKVDDPTKIIIAYGVNDCFSRFVTVRKEDVIELLFSNFS